MDNNKLTQAAFARAIGIAPQAVNGMLHGKTVTDTTAEAVVKAFPEYCVEWILYGTPYATVAEKARYERFEKTLTDEKILDDAVSMLVQLNGWAVSTVNEPSSHETEFSSGKYGWIAERIEVDGVQGIEAHYKFSNSDHEAFFMNSSEIEVFKDEIKEYVGYRLKRIQSIHNNCAVDIERGI